VGAISLIHAYNLFVIVQTAKLCKWYVTIACVQNLLIICDISHYDLCALWEICIGCCTIFTTCSL